MPMLRSELMREFVEPLNNLFGSNIPSDQFSGLYIFSYCDFRADIFWGFRALIG